jgi:HNH endonuclease
LNHLTIAAPESSIEFGTCHCGCGRKTYVPPFNVPQRGFVKGVPMRYWRSHGDFPFHVDLKPFEMDGVLCRRIHVGRGRFTVVCDSDYDLVSRYKWYCLRGYAYGCLLSGNGKKLVAMGRLLLGLPKDDPLVADHINGDTLDNRRSNLRAATRAQNGFNAGMRSSNKSGYLGVCKDRKTGCWNSQGRYKGRVAYLGMFRTPEAAHFVYCWFARQHYEGFSRDGSLNFSSDSACVEFVETNDEMGFNIRFKSGGHGDEDAYRIIAAIARLTLKYPRADLR